jgi:hypothetical protein
MPIKDPEARAAYMKLYREKNRQKLLDYDVIYRLDNKKQIAEQQKVWAKQNYEKIRCRQKQYQQTPNGKRINTIGNWKTKGLIHDDYDLLYDHYLNTTHCDVCKYEFDSSNWRCMDHDHQTGLFRQILCNECNRHDSWMNKI